MGPLTPPLGVGATRASGLDLALGTLCGLAEATVAIEPVFSKILLVGVTSALLIGVDLFASVDIERRPVVDDTDSTVALTVERRALLGFTGLLMLLGAGPVELLRLRFKEEFSLPERRHKSRIVAHSDCLVTARMKLTVFFSVRRWFFSYHSQK